MTGFQEDIKQPSRFLLGRLLAKGMRVGQEEGPWNSLLLSLGTPVLRIEPRNCQESLLLATQDRSCLNRPITAHKQMITYLIWGVSSILLYLHGMLVSVEAGQNDICTHLQPSKLQPFWSPCMAPKILQLAT